MKIIQTGLGKMGHRWVGAITNTPDVTLAGVVEIDVDRAQAVLDEYDLTDVPIFGTLAEALDAVDADGIIEVTPPFTRLDNARVAAEAGVPLVSEKAMAATMEDAYAIVALADSTGVPHFISQDYRYKPPIQTLKSIVDRGELGRINSITLEHYRGLVLPGFHMQLKSPILMDMSIHHFDLLRFILGMDPVSLFAQSWNPSNSAHAGHAAVSAIINFPQDVTVTYSASWATTGHPTDWNGNWRIDCEGGVILMRDNAVTVQRWANPDNSDHYDYEDAELVPEVVMPRSRQEYLVDELQRVAREGATPGTPVQDNQFSLQMVFDALESSEMRQVVYPKITRLPTPTEPTLTGVSAR